MARLPVVTVWSVRSNTQSWVLARLPGGAVSSADEAVAFIAATLAPLNVDPAGLAAAGFTHNGTRVDATASWMERLGRQRGSGRAPATATQPGTASRTAGSPRQVRRTGTRVRPSHQDGAGEG